MKLDNSKKIKMLRRSLNFSPSLHKFRQAFLSKYSRPQILCLQNIFLCNAHSQIDAEDHCKETNIYKFVTKIRRCNDGTSLCQNKYMKSTLVKLVLGEILCQ